MNHYQYQDLTIEVLDVPIYTCDSADNSFVYNKHYFSGDEQDYHTSKHGIKIFRDESIIDSCIVIGSYGPTGVHQNSSLLDGDQLLVCCGNTVFCLTLPDLNLKWKTQADWATCFQIFKHQDAYIVHGELDVTKLNKDGQVEWQFSGADIFVSIDNEVAFTIESDGILLTDFNKAKYKIDFDGKLLWDTFK